MSFDLSAYLHLGSDDIYPDGFNKLNNLNAAIEAALNQLLTSLENHNHSAATGSIAITICTSTTRPSSPALGELIIETDTSKIYQCTNATGPVWTYIFSLAEWMILSEQGSAPSTGASQGALYIKDVSGQPELFYREESDGDEVQITSGGALNVTDPDPLALSETTAPSTSAGQIKLYAKDSGTQPELFMREESDGDEVQITEDGKLVGRFNWLTAAQGVVGSGTSTTFTSVDCSADVPAGTQAVVLLVQLHTIYSGSYSSGGVVVRQDSTNGAEQTIYSHYHSGLSTDQYYQVVVGLDAARTFDYKATSGTHPVTLSIVGYM